MPQQSKKCQQVTVLKTHHENFSCERFSCSLIQAVSEAIDIDPTETQLHLDDYLCLDHLDQSTMMEIPDAVEAIIHFEYGGYNVECNFDGEITITAKREAYELGEVPLPDSMR